MKAMLINAYGEDAVFEAADVPIPDVRSCASTAAATNWRLGRPFGLKIVR